MRPLTTSFAEGSSTFAPALPPRASLYRLDDRRGFAPLAALIPRLSCKRCSPQAPLAKLKGRQPIPRRAELAINTDTRQSVADPNALPLPSPACRHLLELITVVVVVVRRGGYSEEAPVMAVVAKVTPSDAPIAAKVPNARSTKVANADGTHTATAEPAAKGGTVRAAARVDPCTAAAPMTVAASNGGIEWNRDGQSRHGY